MTMLYRALRPLPKPVPLNTFGVTVGPTLCVVNKQNYITGGLGYSSNAFRYILDSSSSYFAWLGYTGGSGSPSNQTILYVYNGGSHTTLPTQAFTDNVTSRLSYGVSQAAFCKISPDETKVLVATQNNNSSGVFGNTTVFAGAQNSISLYSQSGGTWSHTSDKINAGLGGSACSWNPDSTTFAVVLDGIGIGIGTTSGGISILGQYGGPPGNAFLNVTALCWLNSTDLLVANSNGKYVTSSLYVIRWGGGSSFTSLTVTGISGMYFPELYFRNSVLYATSGSQGITILSYNGNGGFSTLYVNASIPNGGTSSNQGGLVTQNAAFYSDSGQGRMYCVTNPYLNVSSTGAGHQALFSTSPSYGVVGSEHVPIAVGHNVSNAVSSVMGTTNQLIVMTTAGMIAVDPTILS